MDLARQKIIKISVKGGGTITKKRGWGRKQQQKNNPKETKIPSSYQLRSQLVLDISDWLNNSIFHLSQRFSMLLHHKSLFIHKCWCQGVERNANMILNLPTDCCRSGWCSLRGCGCYGLVLVQGTVKQLVVISCMCKTEVSYSCWVWNNVYFFSPSSELLCFLAGAGWQTHPCGSQQ